MEISIKYTLKVIHGQGSHDIQVSSSASFGEFKQMLVEKTSLQPSQQCLLFRGREVTDGEIISEAGVIDGMTLMLSERKDAGMRQMAETAKASLKQVHMEVNKYQLQVRELQDAVRRGAKVDERHVTVVTELLMAQLLKLDGIVAEGELKLQRRNEVKRVQQLVEEVDRLKGYSGPRAPAPLPPSSASPSPVSLPPSSASPSPVSQMDSVQAAINNALARRRLSQATTVSTGLPTVQEVAHSQRPNQGASANPNPNPNPKAVSVNTSLGTFDGSENRFQQTSANEEQVPRSNDPSRQSIGSQSPKDVRPSGPGNPTMQKPILQTRGKNDSAPSQPVVAGSIDKHSLPRRTVSLENLSTDPSPPLSPASTTRSILKTSRSTGHVSSTASSSTPSPTLSLADSISTFPPTAVPKAGVASPRSRTRRVRLVSVPPPAPSDTWRPSSASSSSAKTSSDDSNSPAQPEDVDAFSTFPSSAVPRTQAVVLVSRGSGERRRPSGSSRSHHRGSGSDTHAKSGLSSSSAAVASRPLPDSGSQNAENGQKVPNAPPENGQQGPATNKLQVQVGETTPPPPLPPDLISFSNHMPSPEPSVSPGHVYSPQSGLVTAQNPDGIRSIQSLTENFYPQTIPTSPVLPDGPNFGSGALRPSFPPSHLSLLSGPQAMNASYPMASMVSGMEQLRFSDSNPFAPSPLSVGGGGFQTSGSNNANPNLAATNVGFPLLPNNPNLNSANVGFPLPSTNPNLSSTNVGYSMSPNYNPNLSSSNEGFPVPLSNNPNLTSNGMGLSVPPPQNSGSAMTQWERFG